MARQKCTFKWKDKSVRLNGKTKLYVLARQMEQDEKYKSVRLNGKSKVYD